MMTTKNEKHKDGVKFDTGKLRYELIPPEFLRGLAEVLTYGAKKYEARNWEKGLDEDRLVGAAMRHLELHRTGELVDPDTGYMHLDHSAWNLLAASTLRQRKMNT